MNVIRKNTLVGISTNSPLSESKASSLRGGKVKTIIKKLANDRANKLEAVPFGIKNEKIKEILVNSDFNRLRQKLGRNLSLIGKQAMGVVPFGDKFIVDVYDVIDVELIGKFEQKVLATNGSMFIHNNVEYPIYTKYWFKKGKPTIKTYVEIIDKKDKKKELEVSKPYTFEGMDELPVEVFFNNAERTNDVVDALVQDDLNRLQYLDDQLIKEWNVSKSLLMKNQNFSGDNKTAREDLKRLQDGEGIIEQDGFGSQLGNPTVVTPANSSTGILLSNISILEDDIYTKLGLKRDLIGGAQKTEIEVITNNEGQIDTIDALRLLREDHYKHFFGKLFKLCGVEKEDIELILSFSERAKREPFEVKMENERAKAINLIAQTASMGDTPKEVEGEGVQEGEGDLNE